MKLTVLICTHNRSDLLSKTLISINNSIFPIDTGISILVVANACSDETICLLNNYKNKQNNDNLIPLEFTEELRPGKSFALNKALEIINKGWVCLVDDDHRIDINYFKAIYSAIHNHTDITIFCGKIIPDWTGGEPDWVHYTGTYKITPYPIPYFDLGDSEIIINENTSLPGGGNLIINSEVFERNGKFSEALGPKGHNLMGSEDSDFILRCLKNDEKLLYIPDIIQHHYVDQKHLKLKYILKKSYQRNLSLTLARFPAKQYPPIYLWIKLLKYATLALFSLTIKNKLRFYLSKTTGIIGQILGNLKKQ